MMNSAAAPETPPLNSAVLIQACKVRKKNINDPLTEQYLQTNLISSLKRIFIPITGFISGESLGYLQDKSAKVRICLDYSRDVDEKKLIIR